MSRLGLVSLLVVTGCSFGIKTSSGPTTPTSEPECSESEVRPGFDGTMAAWSVATAALAGADLSSHDCDVSDPYYYERGHSCSAYGVVIGGSIALAALFTVATVYGVKHASQCERENDRYEEYEKQRPPVLAMATPPTYASKDWPPELIAACEAERAAMLANAASSAVREQITEDMICGPAPIRAQQPRSRKRYRGTSSSGIGAGFLVGGITLALGAGIWADR